jgi:hypothetical protein
MFFLKELYSTLKKEYNKSDVEHKYLLFGIVANIPTPALFFPYVTQAITLIITLLFAKQMIDNKTTSPLRFILVAGILLAQLLWVPFVTQLVTILLFGILFVITRRDK